MGNRRSAVTTRQVDSEKAFQNGEDAQVLQVLREITARGSHAEVHGRQDGTYQVYEVKKHKITVS